MAEAATINSWRLKSAGPLNWGDRLVTGAKNKYFMVSADSHANEPIDFLTARITDPAYRDRIFRPFERLNGKQYPGSGLGLTLARKAVEQHGGRVSLTSQEDVGTTITVRIPLS